MESEKVTKMKKLLFTVIGLLLFIIFPKITQVESKSKGQSSLTCIYKGGISGSGYKERKYILKKKDY